MLRRALRRERASEREETRPRRSGEGQPLRAFGSGRCVCTTRFVEGGAGQRGRERTLQTHRQCRHRTAGAVAVTAVQVHGAWRLVAVRATGLVRGRSQICTRINSRPGIAAGVGVVLMVMVMVTKVSRARLTPMPAISRHRCPAELERKHGEQENGEEATHDRKSSCYRVCPGACKASKSWGFTTLTRGCERRCGSSHGGSRAGKASA